MGVYLGQSTKIVDRATGEIFYGRVPPYSVVVAGTLPGGRPASGRRLLRRHRQARRRAHPRQDLDQRVAEGLNAGPGGAAKSTEALLLQFLFGLHGRLSRRGFWLFAALAAALNLALGLSYYVYETRYGGFETGMPAPWPTSAGGKAAVLSWFLLQVLLQFASITVCLRRLHDRGRSAGWLIPYVALPYALFVLSQYWSQTRHGDPLGPAAGVAALAIAALAFLDLACLKGMTGTNRFGPDPRAS